MFLTSQNLVLRALNNEFSSSVDSGMFARRLIFFPIYRNFAMHSANKTQIDSDREVIVWKGFSGLLFDMTIIIIEKNLYSLLSHAIISKAFEPVSDVLHGLKILANDFKVPRGERCMPVKLGAIHKLRWQDFGNFWPPPNHRWQVCKYYFSLCFIVYIWL